jgi:hypothetical protein
MCPDTYLHRIHTYVCKCVRVHYIGSADDLTLIVTTYDFRENIQSDDERLAEPENIC